MALFDHKDFSNKRLSKKEFQEKTDEILGLLKTEVKPFEDTSKAAIKERTERCRHDRFEFGRTYLPHYFKTASADFHLEVDQLIHAPYTPGELRDPLILAAPREHAKSTAITQLQAMHAACYGYRHFIIFGSDTADLAGDFSAYVFLELIENERLTADFGRLLNPRQSIYDYVTTTDVRILCRGAGQRIRGLKHGPYRPDLVFLDDMENDTNVKNPKLVQARLDWVTDVVLPGIAEDGLLVWVGTILARKSALGIATSSNKEPYKNWIRRIYRAIQNGQPLWPAHWPLKKLLAKKKQIGTISFNKEYQNNPTDDDAPFKEDWFVWRPRAEILEMAKGLKAGSATDPSSTEAGDDKGHVVAALDTGTMTYYVLEVWGKKLTPAGLMKALYQSYDRNHWLSGCIEENSLKDYLKESIASAAKDHGRWLPLVGVQNSRNKEARIIGTLSPIAEFGRLVLPEGDPEAEALVEELVYILDGTTPDNRADALEMAVRFVEAMPNGAVNFEATDTRTQWGEGPGDEDEPGDHEVGRFAVARDLVRGIGVY